MALMQLNHGTERAILQASPSVATIERREFSITSDALLLSAVVHEVTGSVVIELYSIVDGQQSLLISFPAVLTPTTSPLTDRTPIINGSLLLVVTSTGPCRYTIMGRAVGSGSSTVSGSVTVTNFPVLQDVEVQNWPTSLDDNLRLKILRAVDREQLLTYADFGTKDQRITQIDYQAASVGGFTARKTLTYTLVGNRYRRDTIEWSIV